ncbi:MAG: hypothetical protein JSW05_11500 [Candidatus Thorarchaeota archaeon]|nr:MAG: hypothetical protein JSW05_11500 [Candidatus Thorarchaeota archaeon]
MRYLNSITPRQLSTLWWTERWVRYLVFLLFPVGIIDAVYTITITWQLGPEVEFNPIARYLIAADLWLPWALLDIIGFALFSMLAGSYYLHSRKTYGGPDTTWITAIISLRVAMTTYNVTYYHIPFFIAVYPPFWTSTFMFALTYFGIGRLLNRTSDISRQSIRQYFRTRIDNIKDRRLISAATRHSSATQTTGSGEALVTQKRKVATLDDLSLPKTPWSRRIAYLTMAALTIVSMVMVLEVVGVATGLFTFREQYHIVFINTLVGRGLVASLVVVLFFMAISMYMIFKAFESPTDLPT